jgi:membrane protein YdbS with pleckstrin-like domain
MTENENPLIKDDSKNEPANTETLIWEGNPKWQTDMGFILKSFFIIIIGFTLLTLLLRTNRFYIGKIPTFIKVLLPLCISAIGFGMFTYIRLRRKNEHYKITNLNIEIEQGILSKKVNNLEMWRVRDIEYTQSLSDRIFGVSRVTLMTQDKTHPQVILEGLPPGRRIYEDIKQAFLLAKQRKNIIGMVE